MPLKFEELKILQTSETIADDIWNEVNKWDPFTRDLVGKQFTKSVVSIGANIAEAFGRFHYGEKLQVLYYARGSLYETKYWLNRATERELLSPTLGKNYAGDLTGLAHQLNTFLSRIRKLSRSRNSEPSIISETGAEYISHSVDNEPLPLFTSEEL